MVRFPEGLRDAPGPTVQGFISWRRRRVAPNNVWIVLDDFLTNSSREKEWNYKNYDKPVIRGKKQVNLSQYIYFLIIPATNSAKPADPSW